jgi:hypothetical protein
MKDDLMASLRPDDEVEKRLNDSAAAAAAAVSGSPSLAASDGAASDDDDSLPPSFASSSGSEDEGGDSGSDEDSNPDSNASSRPPSFASSSGSSPGNSVVSRRKRREASGVKSPSGFDPFTFDPSRFDFSKTLRTVSYAVPAPHEKSRTALEGLHVERGAVSVDRSEIAAAAAAAAATATTRETFRETNRNESSSFRNSARRRAELSSWRTRWMGSLAVSKPRDADSGVGERVSPEEETFRARVATAVTSFRGLEDPNPTEGTPGFDARLPAATRAVSARAVRDASALEWLLDEPGWRAARAYRGSVRRCAFFRAGGGAGAGRWRETPNACFESVPDICGAFCAKSTAKCVHALGRCFEVSCRAGHADAVVHARCWRAAACEPDDAARPRRNDDGSRRRRSPRWRLDARRARCGS